MYNKDFSIFEVEGLSVDKIFDVLAALYQTKLAKDLNHSGIEKYFSVFIVLDIMENGCSQKLLAEILHVDESAMEGIIDELVQKGFVNQFLNPDDPGEYNVVLTAKAKEYVPEIKDVIYRENNKNKKTDALENKDKQNLTNKRDFLKSSLKNPIYKQSNKQSHEK